MRSPSWKVGTKTVGDHGGTQQQRQHRDKKDPMLKGSSRDRAKKRITTGLRTARMGFNARTMQAYLKRHDMDTHNRSKQISSVMRWTLTVEEGWGTVPIPVSFKCPIAQDLMRDPVVTCEKACGAQRQLGL